MVRWVVLAICLLTPIVMADEEDKQKIRELEDRVRELEQDRAEPKGDAPKGDAEAEAERQRILEEEIEGFVDDTGGLGLNLVVRRGNVQGIFQMFGSVGTVYNNPETPGVSNAFFFNGTVDLFFTARVGDHFHVLSETVFLHNTGQTTQSSKWDQERLWGAWKFSDLIQVKLGLEHGPISLWNRLFHHGNWLELTIARPLLAAFESSQGILPMHDMGVEVSGAFNPQAGRLTYTVFISNGRGPKVTQVQEFTDVNDDKAVTVGIGFEPGAIEGLYVAIFWRTDGIPPDSTDPARTNSIRNYIFSFQLRYDGEKIEVLSELVYIENADRTSRQNFGHSSGYVQVGYLLTEDWTPYIRLDFREMEAGDPYYMPVNRDLDIWQILVGVRFDFIPNAAMKLEVAFGENERRDGAGIITEGGYVRIGFQLAWVF